MWVALSGTTPILRFIRDLWPAGAPVHARPCHHEPRPCRTRHRGDRVPPSRPPGVVPLRPLTLGELLDAAVGLLRRNAAVLVPAGAVVALAEQGALYPLRQAARLAPPAYLPHVDHLGLFWQQFALGLGTEAAAIALLGGLAARAAGPDLLGERLPAGRLLALHGSRALPVMVV